MKSFDECCDAFHGARKAQQAHFASAFWLHAQTAHTRQKHQQYLDLDHWPSSPLLRGLTTEDRAALQTWGQEHSEALRGFHDQKDALRSQLLSVLGEALNALGTEAGISFVNSSGDFDARCSAVEAHARQRRAMKLDGIAYVSITNDPASNFSRGFFQAAKLKAREFLKDALLVQAFREGRFVANSDLERLGKLIVT